MPHDHSIFGHDATAYAKLEFPAAVQRVLAKSKVKGDASAEAKVEVVPRVAVAVAAAEVAILA